jgi:DNA-binding response OmpR family regulator
MITRTTNTQRLSERMVRLQHEGNDARHAETTGRILIIDDEPNTRLVFRTALEAAGHIVFDAPDGHRGLIRLLEFPADLVLLDLQMPRMGGMEVLSRLRDSGDDIPVVIVTAHGSIPNAVAAMKLGAIDFLTKPLAPADLLKVVDDVLRRRFPAKAETRRTEGGGPLGLELMRAKRALNRREFRQAEHLLQKAIDLLPESAEAHNLMGVLHEMLRENHAAYQSFRRALTIDKRHAAALDNMRRYCQRSGLDLNNPEINPGARN